MRQLHADRPDEGKTHKYLAQLVHTSSAAPLGSHSQTYGLVCSPHLPLLGVMYFIERAPNNNTQDTHTHTPSMCQHTPTAYKYPDVWWEPWRLVRPSTRSCTAQEPVRLLVVPQQLVTCRPALPRHTTSMQAKACLQPMTDSTTRSKAQLHYWCTPQQETVH